MSAPALEPADSEPSNDALMKDGPLNYAPKRTRRLGQHRKLNDALKGMDTAPPGKMPETSESPWKQETQNRNFEINVAVAELCAKPATPPERIPDPPLSRSPPSAFTGVARLWGAVLTAAAMAGVAGYLWGSARFIKSTQLAHTPGVGNFAPSPSAPATGLANSNSASKAPVARPQATDLASAGSRSRANDVPSVEASRQPVPPTTDAKSAVLSAASPTSAAKSAAPVSHASVHSETRKTLPKGEATPESALMIKSGAELMANGDIAAARMMFQRAAEAGEAVAAYALAETYDPLVLKKLRTRGAIAPDIARAQHWYEKARELGSTAAAERIATLTQTPH